MNHPISALNIVILALMSVACTGVSSRSGQPIISDTVESKKRIVLFFDGTRNVRSTKTNVGRLYEKVEGVRVGRDGIPQQAIYMQGVGTRPSDFFTGAALGRGVSRDVREAYETLRREYREGDEIWLFGFSRGAFTARSLAGFVAQYGLLKDKADLKVADLYQDYRHINQNHPIYWLPNVPEAKRTAFENKLLTNSRVTRIRFTGVWDTVGAIGIPFGNSRFSARKNHFFEVDPRMVYDDCYQALAVDEQRPHYKPILWTKFIPLGDSKPGSTGTPRIEQRWFVGAHSNVGGGYKNPVGLYKVSLKWMEDKAAAAGLGIAHREVLRGDEHLERINDSFGEFFPYRLVPSIHRAPRPVPRGSKKIEGQGIENPGTSYALGEVIDETVYDRIKKGGKMGESYHPF